MNQKNKDSLSKLMTRNRARKGMSQYGLGEAAGISRNWVQFLEAGEKNCSYDVLERISRALTPDLPLTDWLIAFSERHVLSSSKLDERIRSLTLSDLEKAAESVRMRNLDHSHKTPTSLRTFPHGFEPLTVVVGDRRENPPMTTGDLIAGSPSADDLRNLFCLGLSDKSTNIRTDKQFMQATNPEADLRESYGSTNLLIVGSPFVCYLSRAMQLFTFFKWQPMSLMRTWYDSLNEIRRLNGSELLVFFELADTPNLNVKELRQLGEPPVATQRIQEIRELVNTLRQGNRQPLKEAYRPIGAIDPIGQRIHPASWGVQRSTAVISFCRNPFADSDRFVAITVAGVHLAGTVSALKALGGDDMFQEHPYGGVLDVYHPKGVEDAFWSWLTPPYTEEQAIEVLEQATTNDHRESTFADWSDQEIAEALSIYQRLLTLKAENQE